MVFVCVDCGASLCLVFVLITVLCGFSLGCTLVLVRFHDGVGLVLVCVL